MTELLKVDNLSAGYGEAVVLHGVSVSINEGETLALLGRNGTGKTTFMNTLAGATRQHGGTIALGGAALHKLPQHERAAAGIGWVPQERNIFKSLTVDENLTAVARPARAGQPLASLRYPSARDEVSSTSAAPPAAASFSEALPLNLCAFTVSALLTSPRASTLICSFLPCTRPFSRISSGVMLLRFSGRFSVIVAIASATS